jgi:predicted ATP-grasp superfamily ATP-dependent carboligase
MKSVLLGNDPARLKIILPGIDEERFRPTVADFSDPELAMSEFDCVVPFTLIDYVHLRHRPDLCRIRCLIPRSELVEILDDKYLGNRLLIDLGFGAYVPEMLDRVTSWPIIYKKKKDSWGLNSFLCFSEDALKIFESSIKTREFFKQEYVPGSSEYATHMLSVGGRVTYHSTVKYTFDFEFYVKGKWFPAPEPEFCDSPCYRPLSAIIRRMKYTGTSCFNYKMAANGLRLFEINPRFGHSLGLDINRYLAAYADALTGPGQDPSKIAGSMSKHANAAEPKNGDRTDPRAP